MRAGISGNTVSMPWNLSQFGLLLRLRRCSHLRHNFATSYRSRDSMRISSFATHRLPRDGSSDFEAQSHGFTTCCLRLKTPFPDAYQGSLPVGGQAFPGGLVPAGFQ